MSHFKFFSIGIIVAVALTGCTSPSVEGVKPQLALKPVAFSDLPGWDNDSHEDALQAFRLSCDKLKKLSDDKPMGADPQLRTARAWKEACDVLNRQTLVAVPAKTYFEENFQPFLVGNHTETEGLFTGYYEPLLHGSRTRHGSYTTPLLTRPQDLVTVDLADFREELKGQRIAGRVMDGRLKPYDDRAAIESGSLTGQGLEFVWVDDPVQAFFLHVQGSGRIDLDSGETIHVGYAAQNGHPYKSLGKVLVDRGEIPQDQVSMPALREWLKRSPEKAAAMMQTNPSYVFFREVTDKNTVGAQGVPLTPGRSLAVDNVFLPYGSLLWLDTVDPLDIQRPLRRLMVAQDTGGAIKGPVRGDFFWGHGLDAEQRAGLMKSQGRYFILVPKRV